MIDSDIDMLIIEKLLKKKREEQINERPFVQLEIPLEDLESKEKEKEYVEPKRVIVIEL